MTRDARDEHETDPRDVADAYFLLDDGEARLGVAECCGKFVCTCDDWERPQAQRERKRPMPSRIARDR